MSIKFTNMEPDDPNKAPNNNTTAIESKQNDNNNDGGVVECHGDGDDEFSSSDLHDKLESQPPEEVGSCGNCTRKLRKQPCSQALSKRHSVFLVATGVIQTILFSIFLLDGRLGIYVLPQDLPTYADCGNTESNFSPSFPVFIITIILNVAQLIFDSCSVFVIFLFVRQIKFGTVVLQYFLLATVTTLPQFRNI